ncbi:sigma-54 dependent transcriptional regulator [Fusibacter sp. 3D3]|uniref:sigma-54-dependent transcriptional regulator n=1 Tax=Fusibacter sp. 3D3 TaxID=1048380 RepID=UPI0008532F8B|nr:sigma-54 dependent transcriptional regulator [Fusibacter sp. 3D3]GAU79980.1 response regulator of zinc sigma-54-dependent two-component system [Fusibacter sp. 3D3]
MNHPILIVEDEKDYALGLKEILELEGYLVTVSYSAEEALVQLSKNLYDLVLTDLMLGKTDGITLLEAIKENHYGTKVILMTAYATVENAVQAMKIGASSYYVKGNPIESLIDEIKTILKAGHVINSVYNPMIKTLNKDYQSAINMAIKAAKTPVNILLIGESGSGKEVFANLIHNESERAGKPFVAVNCQALSESVLESELFGHKKGAYTGATEERIGRFEAADGGTLFLDEIADLPLSIQVKLLRVVETRSIERLGSNTNRPVDFRLITATNRSLKDMVERGRFREDFYYRINTVEIAIPPLRQRKEDIRPLAEHFVKIASEQMQKPVHTITDEVWEHLLAYDFKGNVRELKNIMERLVVFSDEEIINAEHLFLKNDVLTPNVDDQPLKDFRNALEKRYITSLLEKNQFNVTKTAEILKITRRQLQNKIKIFEIEKK